jgi:hypothetical protein
MNVILNWTVGSGATSQDVFYKLASASTWTKFSTLTGSATTETVTGLNDNVIYDLKITTACSGGSPSSSATVQKINIICPTVTTTVASTEIGYSFPNIGGSVDSYSVKLYASNGTTEIATSTPTGTTTRSGAFSTLTSSTTYKLRVIPTAGTITKSDCPLISVTTTTPPTCSVPTGVTATLVAV